jgi:peptidoglycan/xylan/chitin deacetylase (PgdA/CDA1 family)
MLKFKFFIVTTILGLIAIIIGFYANKNVWWFVLGYICLSSITLFIASMTLSWQFFVKAITRNKNVTKPFFCITFDDGPNPKYTPLVLEILKKYKAKATFFLIGKEAVTYPDLVKQILKEGHDIGNHTYTHSTISGGFNTKQWLMEIEKTTAVLQNETRPIKWFRPPFGVSTPNLANALKQTHLKVVGWNKRSFDTFFKNEDHILKLISQNLKPGDIILLHDKQPNCIPVLERLLQIAQEKQLLPVTINQLLDEK